MAITYVGGDQDDRTSGTTLTFPSYPTAIADDVAVMVFYNDQDLYTHSIGTATGWTQIANQLTTPGRDMHTSVWWKRLTSSEGQPAPKKSSSNEEFSATVHIFRGVDLLTDPKITSSAEENLPDLTPETLPPSIDTVFDSAAGLYVLCVSHDRITSVSTPTGFTLGETITGSAKDFRQQTGAYDLDLGTAGTKSPAAFSHPQSLVGAEYHGYWIVFENAQSIHITGGTATSDFQWVDTNLTIIGDGFESTQGTGKVEFWDDLSGTTKVSQSVDTWSDTNIQIDGTRGSFSQNGQFYLVVTNNSGDESAPILVTAGVAPYEYELRDVLLPDHYWRLNNVYSDTGNSDIALRDMDVAVVGTWSFSTGNIVEGNTHALVFNNDTDSREITDAWDMNIVNDSDERTISFWLQIGGIQHQLAAFWKEGGTIQNLVFMIGYGNVLLFQGADDPGNAINAQSWSGFRLAANRPYHVCGRYSLLESPKELRLYIDGEEQTESTGNPLGAGVFNDHTGDVVWGKPDSSLETGTVNITYDGLDDALMSDFASWSDLSENTHSGALHKTDDIRDRLFRRGAIPDDIITSATESSMQTALDATADARPDWPLSYRIEEKSGGGDLELTMTDKVFDDRITLQVEWRGNDTLTIVRPTSSNFDAAASWSPNGGTISVIDLLDLIVTVKDVEDKSVISGARVRVEADSGGPATLGTVLLEGTTDGSGQLTGTHRYSSDQPVTGRVRKGSTATYYKTSGLAGTITSAGLELTIFLIPDG